MKNISVLNFIKEQAYRIIPICILWFLILLMREFGNPLDNLIVIFGSAAFIFQHYKIIQVYWIAFLVWLFVSISEIVVLLNIIFEVDIITVPNTINDPSITFFVSAFYLYLFLEIISQFKE